MGSGRLRALSKNDFLEHLEVLNMPYCELTDNAIDVLLKHELEHLRALDLRHTTKYWAATFGHTSWAALAEHDMPALVCLDISGWQHVEDAAALLRAPWIGRLARLRLSPEWITRWQNDARANQTHALELNALLQALHDSELRDEVAEDTIRALSEENPQEV